MAGMHSLQACNVLSQALLMCITHWKVSACCMETELYLCILHG